MAISLNASRQRRCNADWISPLAVPSTALAHSECDVIGRPHQSRNDRCLRGGILMTAPFALLRGWGRYELRLEWFVYAEAE
jgi:hypothetical protein